MLVLCGLGTSYGGCMHYVSSGRPLPGYDAVIRYRPTRPKVIMVRPVPVQTAAPTPALLSRGEVLRTEIAEGRELL